MEERYEARQTSTQEALEEMKKIYEDDVKRKKEQAEKGFDGLTFFIYRTLLDKGLPNSEEVTKQIKEAFINHPNWKDSEKELRELRRSVSFAILTKRMTLTKPLPSWKNCLTIYTLLTSYNGGKVERQDRVQRKSAGTCSKNGH